jgi:hypothetical protein
MYLVAVFAVLLSCSAETATDPGSAPDVPHSGFFVTVDGSQSGDGSADHPWNLATAVAQPSVVKPGDTIWMHGGTYKGDFISTLAGTAMAPIVLRQFPGERATIDGRLDINGQYAYYWGFEVTDSDPLRVSAEAGSRPTDLPRNMVTVFVDGPFNKLINLVIHDLGDGLFSGSTAEGVEIYGSIFYNNGWVGTDRGHGHNVYLQNQNTTKKVFDNVLFNSFDVGLHIYGSDAAYLYNFDIQSNTIFNSGDPVADTFGPTYNILERGAGGNWGRSAFRGNSVYHRDGRLFSVQFNAAGQAPGEDITFSGNIVHGRAQFDEVKGYTITNNKFTSGTDPLTGSYVLIGFTVLAGQPYSSNTWNGNQYSIPAGSTREPFYLVNGTPSNYLFPGWRSTTGYDASGTFTGGQFAGADVIVRPNQYEPGRGLITCWNWSGAAALNVDLSGVLKVGDTYEIRHVFNLFGPPMVSGVYGGGSISVPQPTLTPPAPIGYKASPTMPDNRFNVFIVQKR